MNLQTVFAAALRGRIDEADGAMPTRRQLEVLYYAIAEGMEKHEIAERMVLSVKTVEAQLTMARDRMRYSSNRLMRQDLARRYGREEMRAELESAAA